LIPADDAAWLDQVVPVDVSSLMAPLTPSDASTTAATGKHSAAPTQNQSPTSAAETPTPVAFIADDRAIQWLDSSAIEPNPYQPRQLFKTEELEELVASIREHGVLQPILVRPLPSIDGATRYQLVAGERRWRAARVAGLAQIPALVRIVGDQQSLELALIENVQRQDINPLEAATAYRRLSREFGLSQDDISQRVGKSRSGIANTMRLLELPEEVQAALGDGTLSEGHGRALMLAETEGARRAIFRRIVRDKLTVRDAEQLARTANSTTDTEPGKAEKPKLPPDLEDTQRRLQTLLGTRVRIEPRARGGRISIEYYSEEEYQQLVALLSRAG
jgi:ParB family chromosome partitioning protein